MFVFFSDENVGNQTVDSSHLLSNRVEKNTMVSVFQYNFLFLGKLSMNCGTHKLKKLKWKLEILPWQLNEIK